MAERRRGKSAATAMVKRSWTRFCCGEPTVGLQRHRRPERCCCARRAAGTRTARRHFLRGMETRQRSTHFRAYSCLVAVARVHTGSDSTDWEHFRIRTTFEFQNRAFVM